MRQVVGRLHTFPVKIDELSFPAELDCRQPAIRNSDDPALDTGYMEVVAAHGGAANDDG